MIEAKFKKTLKNKLSRKEIKKYFKELNKQVFIKNDNSVKKFNPIENNNLIYQDWKKEDKEDKGESKSYNNILDKNYYPVNFTDTENSIIPINFNKVLFDTVSYYDFKPNLKSLESSNKNYKENGKIKLDCYHNKLYEKLWINPYNFRKLNLNDDSNKKDLEDLENPYIFKILKPIRKRKPKKEFIPIIENVKFSNKLITKIIWLNPFSEKESSKTYNSSKTNKKTPKFRLISNPVIRAFMKTHNSANLNKHIKQDKIISVILQVKKKDISEIRLLQDENKKLKHNSTKYIHNELIIKNKINIVYDLKGLYNPVEIITGFNKQDKRIYEYYLDYEGLISIFRTISNKYKKELLEYLKQFKPENYKPDKDIFEDIHKSKYPLLNKKINEYNLIKRRFFKQGKEEKPYKQIITIETSKKPLKRYKPRKLKKSDISLIYLRKTSYSEKQILKEINK